MRVLLGSHEGEWLERRLHGWGAVGGVVGTGWDAYARILHPLEGRLLDWTDRGEGVVPRVADERAWTWTQVAAAVGATMHPEVQYGSLASREHETSIGAWEVRPPQDGWLEPALLARLAPLLAAGTSTPDDAVLAVWEGWGNLRPDSGMVVIAWEGDGEAPPAAVPEPPAVSPEVTRALTDPHLLRLPGRTYLRITCALSELEDPDWGFELGIGWSRTWGRDPSPQLIWPRDRAWVLGTEIDLDSTLVGGSRALIDAILADDAFEAFEVTADSDLTYRGDAVNPPRASSD
ncbi:hypothetical protein [Demequina lignilytica]|uniref:Uncharacterized protein n=1 Tax=Demequina lignilytica TaxID=3051663 RepID=A0AB35MJR3_9MICO|nr:hypothetical protein [Demequina sp. SYSU T0a273]MDN4483880.1 hypothetical protein [Demequina sp. SYSU T0a273]